MRVNDEIVTTNPVSTSSLDYCPYFTVSGKIGAMCVSHDHIAWFLDMMKGYNAYLEIGAFDGVALSVYAEAYPSKSFAAIDTFSAGFGTGGGHYDYFFENCKRLDNVSLWIGESYKILPQLTDRFDVIFIDGAHDQDSILLDYIWSWPILNSGGRMIFHDIDLISTKRVIERVEREQNIVRNETSIGVIYVEKV